ncbi:MAG: macro domain-containing protein [Capsulimonadaceae bacterium]
MSYVEYKGNLFASKADTLVNTVNCVGVMGKGVALEFRRRFPEMYLAYRHECDLGHLRPGDILFYGHSNPRVLSLAVKRDWKYPSKYEWVEACLRNFRAEYRMLGIRSIAFPWIGAMNGHLDWPRVHEMMRKNLSDLSDIDIEVVEYDASAPDPLYDVLRSRVIDLGPSGLARASRLSESSAKIICNAVERSAATTLAEVCDLQGLGKITIDNLYQYVRNEPTLEREPQLSLF